MIGKSRQAIRASTKVIIFVFILIVTSQASYSKSHHRETHSPKNGTFVTKEQYEIIKGLISRKSDLDKLYDKLVNAELDLSKSQLDVKNQYFQIYVAVFSIVSLVSGLVILLGQRIIELRMNKFQENLKNDVSKLIRTESYIVFGGTFCSLAVPQWNNYEKTYQKIINGISVSDEERRETRRDIIHARVLSEQGLKYMEPITQEEMATNIWALHVHAKLTNNFVYHKTAELLCAGVSPTQAELSQLIQKAEECLNLSKMSELKIIWYELQQSAASTLLRLGDTKSREIGREVMRNLLLGKTPSRGFSPPPNEWLKLIYQECFPIDPSGQQTDLFGLGPVPPAI